MSKDLTKFSAIIFSLLMLPLFCGCEKRQITNETENKDYPVEVRVESIATPETTETLVPAFGVDSKATTTTEQYTRPIVISPTTTQGLSQLSYPEFRPFRYCKPSTKETSSPIVQTESRSQGDGPVLSGLDVLKSENFAPLYGKRLGLLVNHSSIDRDGTHIIDLLLHNPNVKIVRLFSPEHGLFGNVDTFVSDFIETRTQLQVISLYGKRPEGLPSGYPPPAKLDDLDAVIVDLQDIGARFYTYPAFMAYMMETCAKKDVEVFVLDRPNPINGLYVDGPYQDTDLIGKSTSYLRMPVAHGMTIGELAQMFNDVNHMNCKLHIIKMQNWKRSMYWDETGLRWVNPSPNIRDIDAALLYPGLGMTESVVSMGRGTEEPFHIIGTPYIKDVTPLIEDVQKNMKGIALKPVEFTPSGVAARHHVGENKLCKGVRFKITDRNQIRSVELGLRIMAFMQKYYGTVQDSDNGSTLPLYNITRTRGSNSTLISNKIRDFTTGKIDFKAVLDICNKDADEFKTKRAKYLLY